MNWTQIESELIKAILSRNIRRIGQITDRIRYNAKLNYDQQYALARKLTGISEAEWDELLYEVDVVSQTTFGNLAV
jgi:hypothetical protein